MSLKDKINSIKEKMQQKDEQLDKWAASVTNLNQMLHEYLYEYEPDIKIQKTFRAVVGKDGKMRKIPYSIIRILNVQQIQFEPVTHNIIGYKGRIDITMPGFTRDRIQLLLNRNEANEDSWIMKKKDGTEEQFSDNSLEKLIEDVIDSKS